MTVTLLSVLLCAATAWAAEPTAWTGATVVQRSLVAPDGGLPDESLAPLLRVQEGAPYAPLDARSDLATLDALLDLTRGEVHVEPWVGFDDAGVPFQGVRVEYRVWPAPRVAHVRVHGNHALSDAAVRAALAIAPGDAWAPVTETTRIAALVHALGDAGFPSATARLEVRPRMDGRRDLDVHVDEGSPLRISTVAIRAGGALPPWRARTVLDAVGLGEGRLRTAEALRAGREALLAALSDAGWWEARVTLQVEGDQVVVLVDPRRRWTVTMSGAHAPSRSEARDVLRQEVLAARVLAAPELVLAAGARTLEERLAADGWRDARVLGSIATDGPEVHVELHADVGARRRLGAIHIAGDTTYAERFLRDALLEASPNILGQGVYTDAALDRALADVREFYRANGWLDARLERTATRERPRGPWRVDTDVDIHVTPGSRARVSTLRIEADETSRARMADAGIATDPFFEGLLGSPADPVAIEARARRLVEALTEGGWLDADARTRLDRRTDGDVDVVVTVEPGEQVYLRSVVVRGDRRTRRDVITGAITLQRGTPLAPSKLATVRRRLYELDVFSRVDTTLFGDEDRVKDLVVDVTERPAAYVETGGGLATDLGAKAFLRAGHRNLLGRGHRLTFVGQAGLGWAGDGWTFDGVAPNWRAALRYEAPGLPSLGDRAVADLLVGEETQAMAWRLARSGGNLGVRLSVGARSTVEIGYRAQRRVLQDVDPGVLLPGEAWLGPLSIDATEPGADPRPTLPSAARAQSGVEISLLRDGRDDPFNPRKGTLASLVVGTADRLLTDTAFVRAEASFTAWSPVGPLHAQLRSRGGAGWAPGGRVLPLEERFRLGGGATLRGFDQDAVGPANAMAPEAVAWPDALDGLLDATTRASAQRWVPTGGDAMALVSAELRAPTSLFGLGEGSGTELAAFTDVGNAWVLAAGHEATSSSMDAEPPVRVGVGIGLRQSTPVGPAQLDIGINTTRIEGRGEPLWRLHFTLGAS